MQAINRFNDSLVDDMIDINNSAFFHYKKTKMKKIYLGFVMAISIQLKYVKWQ